MKNFKHLTATIALMIAMAISVRAVPTGNPPMLRLGSNENPYGFSPKAQQAVTEAVSRANYYGRNEIPELIDMLAAKEGVTKDHIYLVAGSGTALELAGMAYFAPGGNVVNISPGYPQIGWAFKRMGGDIKFAPLGKNMGYDFNALLATIDAHTKIVVICNPNNPTGALADPAALKSFLAKVPPEILVVVDEAYLELADSALAINSMSPLVKDHPNLMVTRTFSKAYGMAGMRIGYAIANPAILAKMKKIDPGSAPSFLAAIAAKEALKDPAFMEENRKKYSEVRQYTMQELDKLGLKYNYPQGAFILFDIGIDSGVAREKFLKNGIMVTRPTSFDLAPGDEVVYKNWIRVSLGTKDDMKQFFDVLKGIIEKRW